jgi:hypothetical protein
MGDEREMRCEVVAGSRMMDGIAIGILESTYIP